MDNLEQMNFNNQLSGKKVLVTGNTGFKGAWLTVWLLHLQAKVYGIAKDIPTNPSMFEVMNLREKITHYESDIRDLQAMKTILTEVQPDYVFHLAAQPIVAASYSDPIETI